MTSSLLSRSARLVSILCLAATGCADDAPSAEPTDEADELALMTPRMARVVRNGSVEVPVTIVRTGFEGDVTVEVSGLPANVSAATATIPAGATTGTLSLSAEAAAALASRTAVTLHATGGDAATDAALDVVIADPPGTLDTTFDTDGKVFADLAPGANDVIMAMVRQDGGGIIVVANEITSKSVRWARIDSSGQPDPTFGPLLIDTDSVVHTNTSLQQRADGSLVLAYYRGEGWEREVVVAGFDANGKVLAGFGGLGSKLSLKYADLAILPNRVTLAQGPGGELYVAATDGQTTKIGRITADGTLDPSFGTGGYATVQAIAPTDVSIDLAGRFVLAGNANYDRSVVRLTPDGELDSSFSSDGRVTIAGGSNESFLGPVYLSGGRTAMATGVGGMHGVSVFSENGDLDTAFAGDGLLENVSYPLRLATYGDEIVAAGGNDPLFSYGFTLSRMSAITGAPTAGFGVAGQITFDFAPNKATANAIVIDDLGRAVLGGWREEGDYDSTVLRVWL